MCVFSVSDSIKIIIALYVDDLYLFTSNKDMKDKIITALKSIFEMHDMGQIKKLLGNKVTHATGGEILIDNEEYIDELLNQFNMKDCNHIKTPMIISSVKEEDAESLDRECYQQLVGSLLFLADNVRPDISNTESRLSQANINPTVSDWKQAKRVL